MINFLSKKQFGLLPKNAFGQRLRIQQKVI